MEEYEHVSAPTGFQQPARRSGLAIASFVLGIASLLCCLGPLAGIPSIVMGAVALGRIRRSGGAVRGGGLAATGLVLSIIAVAMALAVMVILMAGLIFVAADPDGAKSLLEEIGRKIQGGF